MKVSNELFEFHKLCEGVHFECYIDPVGVKTIGVGHANQETEPFYEWSKWTAEKVRDVWEKDIAVAEDLANHYLQGAEVPQPYFDALVDIIFNTGANPRTYVKYLRAEEYQLARAQIIRWVYANGVVLLGLVKRRFSMYMHCSGMDNWLELTKVPLSSSNLKNFNKAIAQTGYRVEATNEKPKFVIVRGN